LGSWSGPPFQTHQMEPRQQSPRPPFHTCANHHLSAPSPYSQPPPPLPNTDNYGTIEPQSRLEPPPHGDPQLCLGNPENSRPGSVSVPPWPPNDPSQIGHWHPTSIATPHGTSYFPSYQPNHLGLPVPRQMTWGTTPWPLSPQHHSSVSIPLPPHAPGGIYAPSLVTAGPQRPKQVRATQV